jgi:hypothetical protein
MPRPPSADAISMLRRNSPAHERTSTHERFDQLLEVAILVGLAVVGSVTVVGALHDVIAAFATR